MVLMPGTSRHQIGVKVGRLGWSRVAVGRGHLFSVTCEVRLEIIVFAESWNPAGAVRSFLMLGSVRIENFFLFFSRLEVGGGGPVIIDSFRVSRRLFSWSACFVFNILNWVRAEKTLFLKS
jgi:hypothetical protein